MKQIDEKHLGIKDDDFVATGDTDEEVVNILMDHLRSNHQDQFEKMMENKSEEEMRSELMSKVREAK